MPSSKSVTWQSNGSDFSKSVDYYWRTGIWLWVNHVLEVSPLILSLWEAVVSDFDRRVVLKKWNFDFWDIFWNLEELSWQMQDSRCDSDIDCTCRNFKISYECREFFFSNFIFFQLRDVFRTFSITISGYNFFSNILKILKC